jgi:hypothetical protein
VIGRIKLFIFLQWMELFYIVQQLVDHACLVLIGTAHVKACSKALIKKRLNDFRNSNTWKMIRKKHSSISLIPTSATLKLEKHMLLKIKKSKTIAALPEEEKPWS